MKSGTERQMSAWEKTAKDLFAGSVAGMVSLAVCYPLDIVRTRLQTTDASRFNGVIDCFAKTVKGEGFLALYKGMSSPLAAQALQKAIMFGAYGAAQRFIVGRRDRGTTSSPLTTFELFLCGMFAGSVNTVVAAPIELVRNRLMTQYHAKAAAASGAADATFYTGPIDCCKKIVQQHGLRGLWRGVGPTLLRDGPGVGAWYASFEYVKVCRARPLAHLRDREPSLIYVSCAAPADPRGQDGEGPELLAAASRGRGGWCGVLGDGLPAGHHQVGHANRQGGQVPQHGALRTGAVQVRPPARLLSHCVQC